MASRVLRMFFDRGVVFMPADGRVLLSFHGETGEPLDLTSDLPLLLEAGLVLLDEPTAAATGTSGAALTSASARMVDVASLDFPDRMRVYHDGRRLSGDEVGAAVEATVVAALRSAIAAHAF